MRVVIQRVLSASVAIDGTDMIGQIDRGLLILLGIEEADDSSDVDWLCGKIAGMRIFSDEEGKMNRCITDVDGGALVVSQFTLHASTKKGNRPSFIRAARPEQAIPLYEEFNEKLGKAIGRKVETGQFGAMMNVALINDGPVTITMDSKNKE